MKSTIINTIIGVVVVGLLIVGYFYFRGGDEPAPGLETIGYEEGGVAAAGPNQDFLRILMNLKNIELSGDLFEHPLFSQLRDFTVELTPEPQGRINPFSPLGQ